MSVTTLARHVFSRQRVLPGRVFRASLFALLCLMLMITTSAYTLVLRSGRQVTIPGDFTVTPSAIIYEASPGISFTVWLSNIDFAATERANGEPAGDFARRIKAATQAARAPSAPAPGAMQGVRRASRKVVTNQVLEPSRLRRQAQAEEYERLRHQRGLPSQQELQRRVEEQDRRMRELDRQMEAEKMELEIESLRSELLNARQQLNELSRPLSSQTALYGLTYASPNLHPYLHAPLVQLATPFTFGHRRRFARGRFGHAPHRFPRPPHPGLGQPFPFINTSPALGAGARPQVLAPVPRSSRPAR